MVLRHNEFTNVKQFTGSSRELHHPFMMGCWSQGVPSAMTCLLRLAYFAIVFGLLALSRNLA